MTFNKISQAKFKDLHRQVKELIKAKDFIKPSFAIEDPLKLTHELQTMQIELELQNEDLRISQQNLEDSRSSYAELYDFAPVGYLTASIKGFILKANLTLADMLAVERQLLINQPLSAYIVSEDQDIYYRYVRNLSDLKTRQICELHMKKKDGTKFDVQLEGIVILDKSVDQEKYCIVVIDITHRKLAESSEKYRSLFERASDAIFIYDPDTFIIVDANAATSRIYGYRKDELIGMSCFTLDAELKQSVRSFGRTSTDNEVNLPHRFHRRKDGDVFPVEIINYAITIRGKNLMYSVSKDIKERMRIEEMIVQSEKMLSVGGLAAGMAHEINNPLAGIMHTAYVMSSRLSDKVSTPANLKAAEAAGTSMEAIQKFMESRGILRMLTTINESGRRVADIVENMLTFARKSGGWKASYAFSELIDKTLELAAVDYDLKQHYDFKMIEIKKEYEENLPFVPCDRAKIQQVLLNIFKNGAYAMREAGTEKPLFRIRTRFEKERNKAYIEIEDNGPGMDEETRKRVFEPFYTTKPVGIGTGLGLSVSYFIITENHSGDITVESQPGAGAKFIIGLPLDGGNAGCYTIEGQ